MSRFARNSGVSAPALLTAPIWLPFFVVLALVLFACLLLGLVLLTASLWLDALAEHLVSAAQQGIGYVDAWFNEVVRWRE